MEMLVLFCQCVNLSSGRPQSDARFQSRRDIALPPVFALPSGINLKRDPNLRCLIELLRSKRSEYANHCVRVIAQRNGLPNDSGI